MEADQNAIVLDGVRKRYRRRRGRGEVTMGLSGCTFKVRAGTIHGLIGPNGAGKTTTLRILTTLLQPDEGTATVAGIDVVRNPHRVRDRIGAVGQYAAVDEVLSGRRNLVLFGRLYRLGADRARRRADELLERFDLSNASDRPVATYSGGMRRRLDIALSLVKDPDVLFVDEPTTGLDPVSRIEVWRAIGELAGSGTTVLLTTQYLDEADRLADRLTFLWDGRVVEEGTPAELKARTGNEWIEIDLESELDFSRTCALAAPLTAGDPYLDGESRQVRLPAGDGVKTLTNVAAALHGAGIHPRDLVLRRPTLDEVFLALNERNNRTSEEPA